jgi:cytochrome c oxidase subunit III
MTELVERRRSPANGWWAMLLFICSEATFFGLLIASYVYLRFQVTAWPPPGVEKPKVLLPLVLTAILVSTTIPLFAAVRAGRIGRVQLAWGLVLLAVVIQAAYLGVQIHELVSELDKVNPKHSAYGSIYFTLIGAHHLHVAAGLLLELWVIARLMRGLTDYRMKALQITALYWYFVNAVALAIVVAQISPSL